MKKLFAFLFLIIVFAAQAQDVPPFVKDSLDSYVRRAMADWKIPGVAVCIVKDGKVVASKG